MLESAVAAVAERLGPARSRVHVQIDDNLPLILADPDALTTALINLLENACKYSDEPAPILLRAQASNGRVHFSVQDRGIGIAPRERGRIFQPFYQTDQHLSRRAGGCGLGLSIVQFIASAHQGHVSVESQPGAGSTFTVSLPVAPSHPVTPTRTAKQPPEGRERTQA
jgi:signal transduction histidine kinase